MSNPSSSKERLRTTVPKLVEVIDATVYGDIWERPQLTKRDRSLVTLAALIALRQTDQMRSHLEKALAHGLSAVEITEMITHLAFYAGFPAALSAAQVAKTLLEERGLVEPGNTP